MVLLLILALGAATRLAPVLLSAFPLNDGGLFVTMARDLAGNGMVPPAVTTYNGIGVPFAYPPGGFYLIALFEAAGMRAVDVLRWVPALISIGTIPVVYLIGRSILRSERMGLATAAFFAMSPQSYEWLILGGGITRAPGFLFALVAVALAIRMYLHGGRWAPYLAGAALGVSGLWHPQAGVFGVVSIVVLWPFLAADRRLALRHMTVAIPTAFVVTAPWLIGVVLTHGVEPLMSAAGTGDNPMAGVLAVLASRTSGGYLEVLGIATSLGLVVCALRGFWLVPAWMLAIVLVDGRSGLTYASVPAAMGIAFLLRDVGRVIRDQLADGPRGPVRKLARAAPIVLAVTLLGAGFVDSLASPMRSTSPLRALPSAEREAMEWVATETAHDSSFLVVAGRFWARDPASEWFPVLAERHSVATVQGYEWLGAEQFARHRDRAGLLATCVAASDLACIERWIDESDDIDYLFLTDSPEAEAAGLECCRQLATQIERIRASQVVYQTGAVTIVKLLPNGG